MNRQELKKQMYERPSIEIVHATCYGGIMSTSFPNGGGHHKVGDDGDLNAKEGFFEEEEEEENMLQQQWNI